MKNLNTLIIAIDTSYKNRPLKYIFKYLILFEYILFDVIMQFSFFFFFLNIQVSDRH